MTARVIAWLVLLSVGDVSALVGGIAIGVNFLQPSTPALVCGR